MTSLVQSPEDGLLPSAQEEKTAASWPCGHPRTAENTQSIGVAGIRCRTCRRAINRRWMRKARAIAKATGAAS